MPLSNPEDDAYAREMRTLGWSVVLVAVVELVAVGFIVAATTGHL